MNLNTSTQSTWTEIANTLLDSDKPCSERRREAYELTELFDKESVGRAVVEFYLTEAQYDARLRELLFTHLTPATANAFVDALAHEDAYASELACKTIDALLYHPLMVSALQAGMDSELWAVRTHCDATLLNHGFHPEIRPRSAGELLQEINSSLHKLEVNEWYKSLPAISVRNDYLSGLRIAMLDDVPGILASFVPALQLASAGNARFIHDNGKNSFELLGEVLDARPAVLLVDFCLRESEGAELITMLRQDFDANDLIIVGFSSSLAFAQEFRAAGANIVVEKDPSNVQACLDTLLDKLAPILEQRKRRWEAALRTSRC